MEKQTINEFGHFAYVRLMANGTVPTIFPHVAAYWEKVFLTSSLSLIILITLIGNLIVVVIFSTHHPVRKFSNSFMVSLAVSDFLVGAVNMPVWTAYIVWDCAYTKEVSIFFKLN